jgi:hypothetical protein
VAPHGTGGGCAASEGGRCSARGGCSPPGMRSGCAPCGRKAGRWDERGC